jgi:hypothetical protein
MGTTNYTERNNTLDEGEQQTIQERNNTLDEGEQQTIQSGTTH